MCTVIVNVHTDRCPFFFLFISISSNNTFRADIFHHFHGGTKFSGHHFLCFSFRFGSLTLSQPFFFHLIGLFAQLRTIEIHSYILQT